jgi:hypothetical protein
VPVSCSDVMLPNAPTRSPQTPKQQPQQGSTSINTSKLQSPCRGWAPALTPTVNSSWPASHQGKKPQGAPPAGFTTPSMPGAVAETIPRWVGMQFGPG